MPVAKIAIPCYFDCVTMFLLTVTKPHSKRLSIKTYNFNTVEQIKSGEKVAIQYCNTPCPYLAGRLKTQTK